MDLKEPASRLAEEVGKDIADSYRLKSSAEIAESALLAFGRLVMEEDAKVCEEIYGPADTLYGQALQDCAAAIRAKALE